jgi:hypothetical protein
MRGERAAAVDTVRPLHRSRRDDLPSLPRPAIRELVASVGRPVDVTLCAAAAADGGDCAVNRWVER